jgi:hypothetical protein
MAARGHRSLGGVTTELTLRIWVQIRMQWVFPSAGDRSTMGSGDRCSVGSKPMAYGESHCSLCIPSRLEGRAMFVHSLRPDIDRGTRELAE